MPDVQILVRGPAGVFSGTTGIDGRYAINGVPPGAYDVEALPAAPFSTRYLSATLEIRDARACAVRDFWVRYNGRVAGALVDASGRPAAGIRVDIAPVSAVDEVLRVESADAMSDALGQFELPDIPPGQYVVGIGITPELDPQAVYPRTYFHDPGGSQTRTIEVGAGNRVDAGTLRVPEPLRRYELHGVAVAADGSPMAGASVFLQGPRYRQVATEIKTDGEGRFAVPVFDGQS